MTATPWTFAEESEPIGPWTVTLVNGTSFAICDRSGDMTGGVEGIVVADTRVCSRLALLIDGHRVEPLALSVDDPWAAQFVSRTADHAVIVRRSLLVGRGAALTVELRNRTTEERQLQVRLLVGSDLADVFAVKEGRADGTPLPATALENGSAVRIGAEGSRRAAVVRVVAGEGGDATEDALTWQVGLEPRGSWRCRLEVAAIRDGVELAVTPAFSGPERRRRVPPVLDTDVPGLDVAFVRAIEDLDALRLVDADRPEEAVVAAGAPWFMTLFGRDSLLTAWMMLPFDPVLALTTVRVLARLQGTRTDPETDEQPGRILHEVRFGTAASLSLADADRYYGTVDATPLFVMVVHELWRWGLPWSDVEALLPAVDAALSWVAGAGDPDGDGFLEYARSTPAGLRNQGWKDSWDAIAFADGRLAEAPIAVAEAQAYAYAAWRAGAALAAAAGDHVGAAMRADRAATLRVAFDRAFWVEERGAHALALDGDKRPVDAVASNLGHLLWCGIVAEHRAAAVAATLTSPELASGWGLRTLATSMARYDPLGYHTGSVWPHDTAIAIAGLRRAGCTAEAVALARDLLAATRAVGGRLPELFAGLGPEDLAVPVPYPASCSPQAWASAAPLLVLRALLGLEPDVPNGQIVLDPALPAGASRLAVEGIVLRDRRASIEVDGDAVAVRNLPAGVAVVLQR